MVLENTTLTNTEKEMFLAKREKYEFLGEKDDVKVYRDKRTGEYYCVNGSHIERYGHVGFIPHPIHQERLKMLFERYNPKKLKWINLILAMYQGEEDRLWENMVKKYAMPQKPDKPSWGKSIRKERWARYEKEVEEYQENVDKVKREFYKECDYWNARMAKYNKEMNKAKEHQSQGDTKEENSTPLSKEQKKKSSLPVQKYSIVKQSSSRSQITPYNTYVVKTKVPPGLHAGDKFIINVVGKYFRVRVPLGAKEGTNIHFSLPPNTEIGDVEQLYSNQTKASDKYQSPIYIPSPKSEYMVINSNNHGNKNGDDESNTFKEEESQDTVSFSVTSSKKCLTMSQRFEQTPSIATLSPVFVQKDARREKVHQELRKRLESSNPQDAPFPIAQIKPINN